MKKIINDKLYNTENCEKLLEYYEPIAYPSFLYKSFFNLHHATIYKSKKGTYLKHIGKPKDLLSNPKKEDLKIISEEDFKSLLIKLDQIDIYEKEFGTLEEG